MPISSSRLLLAGIAALALVGAAELLCRTVIFPEWKALSPQIMGANPYFGLYMRPNVSLRRYSPGNYDVVNSTNSFGFRDREQGFAEDLANVWISGDSNTFGTGLDDREVFTALLDAQGLGVANLANEGGGMDVQTPILRRLGEMGHRPRLVVYMMSLNDSIRPYDPARIEPAVPALAARAHEVLLQRAARLTDADLLTPIGLKSMLLHNLSLYGWLKLQAVKIPAIQRRLLASGAVQDVDLVPRGTIEVMRENPGPAVDALFDQTADYAAALGRMVQQRLGASFMVVLMPSHHALYPARFDKYVDHFGLDRSAYDVDLPIRRLGAMLSARGVEWIDTTAALKATGDPQLIFVNDAHFNAKGHAVLAASLLPRLRHRLAAP